MNPNSVQPLVDSPISATMMAAFVLATLAALFIGLSRRGEEPGMPWIAGGFLCLTAWFSWPAEHIPSPIGGFTLEQRFWVSIAIAGTIVMCFGVLTYLGGPGRSRALWSLPLVPAGFVVACFAAGIALPLLPVNVTVMLCYLTAGLRALRRSVEEPGCGHVVLGLAILAVPGTFVVLMGLRTGPAEFRVLAALPIVLFGMTLLTISLLRRRRALEAEIDLRAAAEAALNSAKNSLEETVASRTVELQELVSSLEGFNRSVSHDLRGPLGGIAGLARLASDAVSSGDLDMVTRSLAAISAQADTSTKLITALLQLAHVGDAKLARQTVVLEDLARDVITQLRLGPSSANANATQWIVGELPDVLADADLLRPVLVNLMANALKFSRDADPPIVRIEASVSASEITIHVRDNGVGFAQDAANQLFQPFMRLHGRRFEGHGIGLSIVRRAVERHGGRVWADAQPDQGAAFHFTLPRAA